MSDDEALGERVKQMVKECSTRLAEHVPSVRIFVTWQSEDADSTRFYQYGRGNIFAAEGQVREWLTYQEECARETARQDQREEDAE